MIVLEYELSDISAVTSEWSENIFIKNFLECTFLCIHTHHNRKWNNQYHIDYGRHSSWGSADKFVIRLSLPFINLSIFLLNSSEEILSHPCFEIVSAHSSSNVSAIASRIYYSIISHSSKYIFLTFWLWKFFNRHLYLIYQANPKSL